MRLFGSDDSGKFGYVASISEGENSFNTDIDNDLQYTLKLFAKPADWLHLSVSGLRTATLGSDTSAASGAFWLGEAWARAFGSRTAVPNFQNGALVADGPNRIEGTWFAGADVVIDFPDMMRLWSGYGYYDIDSAGSRSYDPALQYWVAELILRGGKIAPVLAPAYLGLRANALGTYDNDKGYLLDSRYSGTLGYNMRSLSAYSVVLGWQLTGNVSLRGEYTMQDIDLVKGAATAIPGIGEASDDADYYGFEINVSF